MQSAVDNCRTFIRVCVCDHALSISLSVTFAHVIAQYTLQESRSHSLTANSLNIHCCVKRYYSKALPTVAARHSFCIPCV